MTYFLVDQIRFTRREFQRSFSGVSEADACRRLAPMNSISWVIGHLAGQEYRYWITYGQGKNEPPEIVRHCGYGLPASTPPLGEVVPAWQAVMAEADLYLETLTPKIMETFWVVNGHTIEENVGTMLMRNIYHYWSHLGEIISIRQIMGHPNVPEYVDDLTQYMYRIEREE